MDAILIEKAADALPLLAQAVGGAAFCPYFEEFLPLLTKKTVLRIIESVLISLLISSISSYQF